MVSLAGGAREVVAPLVGLGVFVFILWRQRQARVFRPGVTGPIVLLVVGLGSLTSFARAHPFSGEQITWLVVLLALDAIGLGAVRALTVRVWTDESGQAWRQGTWWTVLLWVAGAAAHVVADGASGVGSASALLYLGLTLLAQRLVLGARQGSL